MDPKDNALIEKYAATDPELKALLDEHILFEKQLEKIESKSFLTPAEEKQAKEAAELAEQQRIAEEQAERERQEALRIAREEAAEQARIETEARIKREAEVREQQRLAEEALAAKQAALRPARDKLAAFSSAIGQVQQPQISVEVDRRILTLINNLQKAIQKIADELE